MQNRAFLSSLAAEDVLINSRKWDAANSSNVAEIPT